MTPFHVRGKICKFAPHMNGSNADCAPDMEGSHTDFALHMEQKILPIRTFQLIHLYLSILYDMCVHFLE